MTNHKGDVLLDSYVFVNPKNVVDYLSSGESLSAALQESLPPTSPARTD